MWQVRAQLGHAYRMHNDTLFVSLFLSVYRFELPGNVLKLVVVLAVSFFTALFLARNCPVGAETVHCDSKSDPSSTHRDNSLYTRRFSFYGR